MGKDKQGALYQGEACKGILLIELREAAMIAEELAREKAGHPVWIEVEFQV